MYPFLAHNRYSLYVLHLYQCEDLSCAVSTAFRVTQRKWHEIRAANSTDFPGKQLILFTTHNLLPWMVVHRFLDHRGSTNFRWKSTAYIWANVLSYAMNVTVKAIAVIELTQQLKGSVNSQHPESDLLGSLSNSHLQPKTWNSVSKDWKD